MVSFEHSRDYPKMPAPIEGSGADDFTKLPHPSHKGAILQGLSLFQSLDATITMLPQLTSIPKAVPSARREVGRTSIRLLIALCTDSTQACPQGRLPWQRLGIILECPPRMNLDLRSEEDQ